jgi:hypothetical protein
MSNFRGFKPGVFDVVGHCKACGVPLLSSYARTQGVRREGHKYHGARGYCSTHWRRIQRHGRPDVKLTPIAPRGGPRATVRTREEVLEEYAMVRDEVRSIRQAAERMGMKFSTLDRALYRARQEGIRAALPPQEQMDRAEAQGRPYELPRAR